MPAPLACLDACDAAGCIDSSFLRAHFKMLGGQDIRGLDARCLSNLVSAHQDAAATARGWVPPCSDACGRPLPA